MTADKLAKLIDFHRDSLFTIKEAIKTSKIRPGYDNSANSSAVIHLNTAIEKLGMATFEIEKLR